ncbi:inactive protein RESTRICTED TEV MOVEMENT 2 [Cajanus cajan]|uniref:23.2 kDa heat shock protein n=1 Tax=Cajanus cajan TaxID=3821 RepID=A0A151TVI8_CAJCA|nr:inactive protein RESTRICTED TEV MOVEMENT 2 [Cajanus cajan]KYP71067.1 23.2 kDa heat shock protein [Cajanus cajan]
MERTVANHVYQDFDPFFEWSEDETSATLTVMLPGFTKEQLRVQVTSTPVLRINGERQIFENKRRRFSKEFSIPPYCDTNDVNAKFEGGVLSIKFPKLITPAKPQPQQIPTPQKEKEAAQQDDEVDKKELPPQKEKEPTSHGKEENKKESAEKENETISDDKEKNHKAEEKVAPKEVAQKKVSETAQEGTTTKDLERAKQKITQRLKTRVLDFTVSLRSADQDHQGGVKKGFCVGKCAKLIKRPKIWMNIVVAILLVMVLGLYVKNAFRSSSQGGTNQFDEF